MINKVADKRYRIEELFSEDWTGEIYKGFDLKEKKPVFIRVYNEKYTYDDIFIDNFEVELGRIYRLNDMLVLRAKDGGLVENRIYCVTDAVEGKTLRRLLQNSISGQLSFGRAVSILTKIANLLDYVHSRGIVHGDIRPDNIIVDDNGTAYLTGFAFAKALNNTLTGTVGVGTPEYMAPEAFEIDREALMPSADEYSLAITAYEMICSVTPFGKDDTSFQTMSIRHNNAIPDNPKIHRGGLRDSVSDIFYRALQKYPEDRFATCGLFALALHYIAKPEDDTGFRYRPETSDEIYRKRKAEEKYGYMRAEMQAAESATAYSFSSADLKAGTESEEPADNGEAPDWLEQKRRAENPFISLFEKVKVQRDKNRGKTATIAGKIKAGAKILGLVIVAAALIGLIGMGVRKVPTMFAKTVRLACWGNNINGECSTVPKDKIFIDASAGDGFTVALMKDGTFEGWGRNDSGQRVAPSKTGAKYKKVSAGSDFTVAITTEGSLIATGNSADGRLNVPKGKDFVEIAAGTSHCLALRKDGSIAAWGSNGYGESTAPAGTGYTAIAAGDGFSLALRDSGVIVAWGRRDGSFANVPGDADITAIAAGGTRALALKSDGSILTWGENPGKAPEGVGYKHIAAGRDFCAAVDAIGKITVWGTDDPDQKKVPDGTYKRVIVGAAHAVAVGE